MSDSSTHIINIAPSVPIYLGANVQSGQLDFTNDGKGYTLRNRKTGSYTELGARVTLAMGLTECCARFGHGMVYFFAKPVEYTSSRIYDRSHSFTLSYYQIPDLIYINHKWDDESRQQWFKLPHWHRMDRLSARGNALDNQAVTMPIGLRYERDNYPTVRVCEGKAIANMTYNASGFMYLGFIDEMAQHMKYCNVRQAYWQAPTGNLNAFQVVSGLDAAQRLHQMYQRFRPTTIRIFHEVLSWADQAHDDWVAAGGYTIESDTFLGPELQEKVRAVLNAVPLIQGDRLRDIRAETRDWSEEQNTAYQDYSALAAQAMNSAEGFTAFARYTVDNENWNGLTTADRKQVIDLWDWEQTTAQERGDTPIEGREPNTAPDRAQRGGGARPANVDRLAAGRGGGAATRGGAARRERMAESEESASSQSSFAASPAAARTPQRAIRPSRTTRSAAPLYDLGNSTEAEPSPSSAMKSSQSAIPSTATRGRGRHSLTPGDRSSTGPESPAPSHTDGHSQSAGRGAARGGLRGTSSRQDLRRASSARGTGSLRGSGSVRNLRGSGSVRNRRGAARGNDADVI